MPFYVIDSSNSINNGNANSTALTLTAGDSAIVKADGSVLATGSGGTAIYVTENAYFPTLLVEGLVYGTNRAIESHAGSARITVNGHVVSQSYGVTLDAGYLYVGAAGEVNGGSIGVLLSNGAELTNDGNVYGGSNAVDLSWGTVINNGTMSSRSDTIYYTGEARSTIRNTGTILGNLYTIPGGADPGLNIINSGLWDGRLQLTAGDDFINNTGTITSEIDLYDGDNHLDSRYGFVGGDVVAGNGTDIILLGAGDSGIVGGGGGDTIDGGVGFDTVSYVGSAVGVSVNLLTGTAAGGDARGDHLSNIEGLVGTVVRDTLVGDDGANVLNGLIGRDTLTGNGGNDTIQMAGAGPAVIDAGSGNDLIQLQSADASMYGYAFTAATRVQGGTGYDTLEVRQARVMTFTDTTVRGIEHLLMDDGFDYDFTSADATVASGARLLVDGLALSAGNFLHFNGAAETNGHFDFLGGDAKDIFIGGALGDTFTGGVSGDLLTGGAGADTFVYHETSDSKFSLRDHITDFNAAADHLQFDFAVAAVDAPVSGSASTAADLSALASGHMGVVEAILVTVTGGALAGSKLLLVDANGTAGFQGAGDFCIDVTGMTGTLDVGDFVM